MSILELKNVNYSYNNKFQTVLAMKDISCSFDRGVVYAIVGKSGSGKSTMLSLLAGLDVPQSGQVLFDGKPTSEMDLDKYRRVNKVKNSSRFYQISLSISHISAEVIHFTFGICDLSHLLGDYS